jgi:Ca-activated chloride channel family protein
MKITFTLLLATIASFIINAQDRTLHKANVHYLGSQYDQAEKHYRAVLAKDSNNIIARYNLANTLHKQKKYEEAVIESGKVATKAADKKTRAAAHYNQGVALSRMKKLEASIEAYKNALRLDPNDQQARENLQKALRELKKQQQKQAEQPRSRMSQKEAEQKLKLLQQKEKMIQEKLQNKSKQQGVPRGRDW